MEIRLQKLEDSASSHRYVEMGRKLDEVMDEVRSSKSDMECLKGGLRSLMRVLITNDGHVKVDVGSDEVKGGADVGASNVTTSTCMH